MKNIKEIRANIFHNDIIREKVIFNIKKTESIEELKKDPKSMKLLDKYKYLKKLEKKRKLKMNDKEKPINDGIKLLEEMIIILKETNESFITTKDQIKVVTASTGSGDRKLSRELVSLFNKIDINLNSELPDDVYTKTLIEKIKKVCIKLTKKIEIKINELKKIKQNKFN